MGSRGTASSSTTFPSTTFPSDNLTPEVYSVIGQKTHSGDISTDDKAHEILDRINPKFYDESENYTKYHSNCQRCAPALELQMRGYDVEAMPYSGDANFKDFSDVFKYRSYDYDNNVVQSSKSRYYHQSYDAVKNNPNKFGRGAKAATKTIIDAMNRWGPNSRALMSVRWKDTSSSHIVNVARVGGEICILDGQSGSIDARGSRQIQRYMENTIANHTSLSRVDHLEIKTSGLDRSGILSKIVKKRES